MDFPINITKEEKDFYTVYTATPDVSEAISIATKEKHAIPQRLIELELVNCLKGRLFGDIEDELTEIIQKCADDETREKLIILRSKIV